jgi:hypothetical protein
MRGWRGSAHCAKLSRRSVYLFATTNRISFTNDSLAACLTTPIETALLWAQNKGKLLLPEISKEMLSLIPGVLFHRLPARLWLQDK